MFDRVVGDPDPVVGRRRRSSATGAPRRPRQPGGGPPSRLGPRRDSDPGCRRPRRDAGAAGAGCRSAIRRPRPSPGSVAPADEPRRRQRWRTSPGAGCRCTTPRQHGEERDRQPAAAERRLPNDRSLDIDGRIACTLVTSNLVNRRSNVRTEGGRPWARRIVAGIGTGAVYAVFAVGLVLVFKTTGVLNFAQAEIGTFGTFVTWWLVVEHGQPWALGRAAGLGAAVVHRPRRRAARVPATARGTALHGGGRHRCRHARASARSSSSCGAPARRCSRRRSRARASRSPAWCSRPPA